MSESRPKVESATFASLEFGVDTNTAPHLLPPNQCAGAVNTTFRGASPTQRPAFLNRVLSFENDTVRDAFEDGRFQVASTYESDAGLNSIIVSVSGRVYRIVPDDGFKIQDLTPDVGNPSNILNGYMAQAENYLILQNGLSKPIIFDGAVCRRAMPNEIKTGTVMAYANGRIWYAVNEGFSFRATDLVRGPSGTAANRYRDSVLKETENTFLNEGGDFSVPGNSGGIKAMGVPANLDTSMGQGPLQVFTPETVFSVNAPIDRTTWKDVTYPIQTVSQISYGAKGDKNTVPVNGDIFYRSTDGLRSFKIARQDFGQWRMTPISGEAVLYLRDDSQNLLEFGSATVFDNRLLNTVSPRYSDRGVYHFGFAVLDFNLVSNMRVKLSPAWEGLWTGLRVFQIFKGRFADGERCFMFTLNNCTDKIELWELTLDELFDNGATRIEWSFETREFDLLRPYERKNLSTADMYVDSLWGRVNFALQYKPDSWPGWLPWHSWSECATMEQCLNTSEEVCPVIANLKTQYRPRIRIPQPPNECNNNRVLRQCFNSQFRLAVTGPATIKQMRFNFQDIAESPLADCPVEQPCERLDVCEIDPYGYLADGPCAPVADDVITYDCTVVQISTASPLTTGVVGTAYTQALVVAGGASPYVWSMFSGTLPPGLSLNASTGAISGTPTAPGVYAFAIAVFDLAAPLTGCQKSFSLTIDAPSTPLLYNTQVSYCCVCT